MTRFDLPLKVISTPNQRKHWAAVAKKAKQQRGTACLSTAAHLPSGFVPLEKNEKAVVVLTRVGIGVLDDDNLVASFKAIRDGVADALEVDDKDPRVTWEYAQKESDIFYVRVAISKVPA